MQSIGAVVYGQIVLHAIQREMTFRNTVGIPTNYAPEVGGICVISVWKKNNSRPPFLNKCSKTSIIRQP